MTDYNPEEYFEGVWTWWRLTKYHHGKPGSKAVALKSWGKKAKTKDLADTIYGSLQAQVRYAADQDKHGQQPDRMPHLSTWLNQDRYSDEIGSHAEIREKVEANKCHCGKDVLGPKFKLCCEHEAERVFSAMPAVDERGEPTARGKMLDYYKRNNLGRQPAETREQHRARLVAHSKRAAARFDEKIIGER